MNITYESDNIDEIMLPGFRFHPTDEELVSFYLKRKIQQKPLAIELIRQLDIYKYDPWDLPKLAATGEKEWYFYCPRDRKYRNSARPNRVTRAGFWKATGTDRPVYSSNGSKCIGLKKSLVFYQGRAAKGMKTDWMMHEFRLPTLSNSKKPFDRQSFTVNDSWAICRIFKKTNPNAQRNLSHHSWISSSSPVTDLPTTSAAETSCSNNIFMDFPPYKPVDPTVSLFSIINGDTQQELGFNMFTNLDDMEPALFGDSVSSTTSDTVDFPGSMEQQKCSSSTPLENEIQGSAQNDQQTWFANEISDVVSPWDCFESLEFPVGLCDEWRSNLSWDPLSYPTEVLIDYTSYT